MISALSTEFIKLRRSKVLLLAFIASFLPAMIKCLQHAFGKSCDVADWEWFLASGQEIMVFSMLAAVVLISCFIFSMEYQYNTASYIFTANVSRIKIFIAKMASLLAIIASIFAVSAFSELLFGYLTLRTVLPWILLSKLIKVTAWYILSYFLLSAIIAMLAVLIKRFVISAVAVLGYLMLVFPFHLKGNPYICPFMTPTVVAAKIFNSDNYFATGYYKGISVNITAMTMFLIALAAVSLAVGMFFYNKSDAIR